MDTCENTVDSCVNNSEISSINNAVSDVLCQNLPAVCVSKAGSSPSKQKLVLSDISQSESSEGVTSSNVINESSATSDLENPVKLEVNTNDSSQIKRQDLTAVQRVRPQLSPGSQVSSTVLQSKIVEPHIQIRVLGRKSEKKYKKMVVTVTEAPTPPKLTSSLSVSRHHGLSRHDRTRVASLVDEDTLTCLKCGHKYGSSSNLHRHAVRHLGWRRFKCKLCNLTFFNRSECKRHFRTIHARRMADPGLKPDEFIQQLEPDKIKTQTISMPRVDIAGTKVTASTHDNESSYNISTRKTSRRFDTSPFQRPDYSSKLCTRTGVYEKPRLEILSHQRTRSKSDSVVSAESQTVAPSVKNIDVKTVRDDVVVKPAFSVASMSSLGDITAVQRLQTFESVRTRSSRSVNVPNTLKLESMPSTSLPPNMTNSSLPRPSTLLSESMPSTSVITNVPWKPNTRRSIQTNATKHSGVQIVKKPLLLQHNQGQKSLVQRLGPVSNQPTVELQRLDVATSSGLVSQNTGGVSHNPIVVSQNTGGVSHNPIVVSQNTGGVSHNHVVVSQNTGSVSHNPIVVSQNTGSISHNPIVVSQNTGSISHNHIVVATLPDLQSTSNQKILVKPDPEQVSVTGQIPAVPKHGSITNEITAQLPYSELASRVLTQQPCEVKVMPPRSSDVSGEELAECTDVVTLKNPDGSVFGDIPLNTLPGGATVVGDDIVLLVVNTTDGLSSVDVQPQVQLQTNIQPYTQPHTQPQESLSSVQLAADVQPYARTNIQPYIQPPTEPLLQPITEANIYCGPGSPLLQPSTLEDREVAVVTQRINTRDNRVQTSTIPRETDHSNQSSCPSNQEIAMTVEQVSFATGDEFLQMINEDQRQSNV